MSLLPWFCRKVMCNSKKQILTARNILVYVGLLSLGYIIYNWPTTGLTSQQDCSPEDGPRCLQRFSGRDVASGVKLTEMTRPINGTVKTALPLLDEGQLEPKNWNGQGYQPVPSSKGPLRHCRQCALVTSSGHLSGKKAGREIDQSECVIRMNAAPTVGYESDVGSRTTFRVVGHRNFPRMFDTEDERRLYFVNATTRSEAIVVLWLYSVNVNHNLELMLARKFAPKYKDVTFYLTKQEVMNRNVELFYQELGIPRNAKRMWMSTGWVAMLFALEVCDEIDVFGMIYDDYCKDNPGDKTSYHYFDTLEQECQYYERSEKRIGSGHKFITEKVAFARWAATYNIRFHVPSWEGHGYDPKVQKETVFHKAYSKYKERLHKEGKDRSAKKSADAQKTVDVHKSEHSKKTENAQQSIDAKKTTREKRSTANQQLPERTIDATLHERNRDSVNLENKNVILSGNKEDIIVDKNVIIGKEEKSNNLPPKKPNSNLVKNKILQKDFPIGYKDRTVDGLTVDGLKVIHDDVAKMNDEKEEERLEEKVRELDADLIEEHVQEKERR